nr:uncharacterized protein LOC107457224 [Parasteatoda tepidariorum]
MIANTPDGFIDFIHCLSLSKYRSEVMNMFRLRYLKQFSLIFTLVIGTLKAQDTDPPKPKFPDVFQVEVQGILRDEKVEVDGSLYYDRLTNRAALHYKHQNEFSISIYNFNDNQLMFIKDFTCNVKEIPATGSLFPYSTDGQNKTLNPAEEFFYFTTSVFDREEESLFPSYVFKDTINDTRYGLLNCNVFHIFSKPEFELPDCDSHTCKPTMISLSLKCPPLDPDEEEMHHSYNFFRFRSTIIDENVFQPPVGLHCNTISRKPFPDFPSYYSFSYNLIKEQKEPGNEGGGVYTTYKKVWHDTKLKLIRVDGFDSQGLLQDTRILDFYGKVSYTVIARIPICQADVLDEDIPFYDITLLPKIFFSKKPEDRKDVVYIGKRSVHGMDFDVWTQSYEVRDAQSTVVLEFYFTDNAPQADDEHDSNYFQISHVDAYAYQRDDTTEISELVGLTYTSISNFRSKQKEWEAFDVSSCYDADKKKGFRLKVDGPPMVKNSYEYEEVLEKFYGKIMDETDASVIRINQLKGKFDGIYLTEFTGWILEKIEIDGTKVNKNEPGMEEMFKIIEKAAAAGKFTIVIVKDNQEKTYQITSMTNIIPEVDPPKPTFPDIFQVEVQGIFHTEKREMDGSVFYDRLNNRAVMSYTYQNETTISIFKFNENKLLYIEDIDCTVSEIDENSPTFFPFSIDEVTKKKIISTPDEIFFFTKSKFDRQDFTMFPSYIFTAVLNITMYDLYNCDVQHVFSKPEVELPDCDSHTCKPTLASVSVKCPPPDRERNEVFHTYNFYRFRSYIKDDSVFQPPVGVHCDVPSDKAFPDFPEYYSFSYDSVEEQMNSGTESTIRSKYLRIWHDTKLKLVRLDEFDDEGFIEGTRIFDFYGRVSYTITAISPMCKAVFLKRNTPLEEITPLPKIFFARTPEEKSASYVGKHIPEGQKAEKKYLRISHVDKYTYQTNSETGKDELSATEYLSFSNFRTGPKEWEAFDVASCFNADQKKGFRLKVKESIALNKEHDMYKTYELIEKAAAEGKLTIEINKDEIYKVTDITDIVGRTLAAIAIVTLLMGVVFGILGYYAYLRNIKGPQDAPGIILQTVK